MSKYNIFIRRYVQEKAKKLKKRGIIITEEQIDAIVKKVSTVSGGTLELMHEVDDITNRIMENHYRMKELKKAYIKKLDENKELQDLPLEYSGITINNQEIDLMKIEDSKTPEELHETLESTLNIDPSMDDINLTDKQFLAVKKETFKLYQDTLVDEKESFKDPSVKLKKKIEYLKDKAQLTQEEQTKIDKILSSTSDSNLIIQELDKEFGKDKTHKMYEVIRDCAPVEKPGIKNMTPTSSGNLLNQIKDNYNSITIDDEGKYGAVTLPDGSFDFRHLKKSLEFAKGLGKEVRLNTLIFYNDCPEDLYNLEKSPENTELVKNKLASYVDATTSFVASEYKDTVRSIDVLNEPLNRFPLQGNTPYKNRGDIEQIGNTVSITDNTASGWQKHLNIEDLCDVLTIARTNLPTTDFMYNETNLEDPDKVKATGEIISSIQDYEQKNNIKLIDSIGTQMHIDNDVEITNIENMFRELSKYGLPIEVTEFDMAMTKDIEGLSDTEIELLRQQKLNEIYECIDRLKDECNIRGFTIWSKSDSENFRVSLENEKLISEGKEPIETLHGGYFTEEMTPKSEQLEEMIDVNETTQEIVEEEIEEEQEEKFETYEAYAVTQIIGIIAASSEEQNLEQLCNNISHKFNGLAEKEGKQESSSIMELSTSTETQDLYRYASESIKEAYSNGCSNIEEVISYVGKDVDNYETKSNNDEHTSEVDTMFNDSPTESQTQEKEEEPKVLVKTPSKTESTDVNLSEEGYVLVKHLPSIIGTSLIMIGMFIIIYCLTI